MINMSAWEDVVADTVDELLLDPDNVRLGMKTNALQKDIIADLFANESALDLVDSIAKIGFLTHDLPIAVRRSGNLVVVEGNRRLAALKGIQNPLLVPSHQAKIAKLTAGLDRTALRKITVKVAPTQDQANQVIAALHTGTQRVPWSPVRQAAFFQPQIEAGKSFAQLRAEYPMVDVREFVIRARLLQLFRDVTYSDPDLQDTVNDRKFNVSTLERLYDNVEFRKLAQFVVNEDSATVHGDYKRFSQLAEKLIGDIKRKKINTRTLNKKDSQSYIAYMAELEAFLSNLPATSTATVGATVTLSAPTRASSSSAMPALAPASASAPTSVPAPTSTSVAQASVGRPGSVPSQAGAGKASPTTKQTPAKAPAKDPHLDTSQLNIPPSFPASIANITIELSKLNVNIYPNATLDLMRTYLEKTIKAFAESQSVDIRTAINAKGKYIYVSDCLNWLQLHITSIKATALKQVITKLVNNQKFGGYNVSLDHLNAINHNHQIFATPDDVRECWQMMFPLMKLMLP